jgi:hypothetical protein
MDRLNAKHAQHSVHRAPVSLRVFRAFPELLQFAVIEHWIPDP